MYADVNIWLDLLRLIESVNIGAKRNFEDTFGFI
jgi:hypothetical protein